MNNALATVLPIKCNYVLRYVDDDNDSICFNTDMELEEAIRVSKNGVLRINVSTAQPPKSQPTPAQESDDAAFWSSLPNWYREKIVKRYGEKEAEVASLPIDDARHFTSLPLAIRDRIKLASAAHANKMALYLQNKQKHHEKTAATLERKAQKLVLELFSFSFSL